MKDLLLHIDGCPAPSAKSAIDQALAFVSTIDARGSALAVAARFDATGLAALLGLCSALDEEHKRSVQAFRARASAGDVLGQRSPRP